LRLPFFYGWTIVLVTFLSALLIDGTVLYGFAFFVIPMTKSLDVSRGAFSVVTVLPVLFLPLVPFLGRLVDKRSGPRLLLAAGALATGLVFIATSAVQSFWQFILVFGILGGLVITVAEGGWALQPALISKWFIRKRGRAMALGMMGISAGGFTVAPLIGWLVGAFDWRTAWAVLGIAIILLVATPSALLVRRSPEDVGLAPDGDPPSHPMTQGTDDRVNLTRHDDEYPWTPRQALRTRAFWLILGSWTLGFFGIGSVVIHQVAYAQDKGFSLETATGMATLFAACAFATRLPWGLASERVHVRWLVPLSIVPAGLAVAMLVRVQDVPMLYTYAAVAGLSIGGVPMLMSMAWAVYFGRRHQGAILGVASPIGNGIAMVGPLFAGWMWDLTGSYDAPFTIVAVGMVGAGLLMLLARPPRVPAYQTDS
jgi:MFS family permease